MQLDGYCPKLGLAFEHHGIQHYSKTNLMSPTDEALARRQKDDAEKKRLCVKREIVLLEIPEIPALLALGAVRAYIKELSLSAQIALPKDFDTKKVDLKLAYTAGSYRRFKKRLPKVIGGRLEQSIFRLD